jgi:hypothetical protein
MNNKYNENTEINAYKYWGNNCPSGTDLLLGGKIFETLLFAMKA